MHGNLSVISHKLGLKEKEILGLESTIEEYAELMKEQNFKIAELLRERIIHG